MGPYFQIDRVVADIIETSVSERIDQVIRFGGAGNVDGAVRCKDSVEQPEMRGNSLGMQPIARRGKIDAPAVASRLTDQIENFRVVRKQAVVDRRGVGKVGFQSCLAAT